MDRPVSEGEMEWDLSESNDLQPSIKVTRFDHDRLDQLIQRYASTWIWPSVEFLIRELLRAEVVDIRNDDADFATIHSRVQFHEDGCELDPVVTLTYPGGEQIYDDAISILTPVGAALIGLSAGQSILYPAWGGRQRRFTLLLMLPRAEDPEPQRALEIM